MTDLRTERLVNPMSVEHACSLDWDGCIESDKNDVMQTSRHILVASSEEKLAVTRAICGMQISLAIALNGSNMKANSPAATPVAIGK